MPKVIPKNSSKNKIKNRFEPTSVKYELEFPRSDGDLRKSIHQVGDTNTRYEITEKNSLTYKKWSKLTAEGVAKALGYKKAEKFWFKSLPEGYKLYSYNSDNLGDTQRQVFLFGSAHVSKFMSVNDFIPHAYWLMSDKKLRHDNCSCDTKYHIPKTVRPEAVRVFLKDPPGKRISEIQQYQSIKHQAVAPQMLDRDRASPSMLRIDEMCWVKMEKQSVPFVPPADISRDDHKKFATSKFSIDFWPCIVHDLQLVVEVTQGKPHHKYIYEVFLLGTKTLLFVDSSRVIPYLAHTLSHSSFPPIPFPQPRFQRKPDILSEVISLMPNIGDKDVYDRGLALSVAIIASFYIKHHLTPLHHYKIIVKNEPTPIDCFKGVWLGAEMVWVGDMVRLYFNINIASPTQIENALSHCLFVNQIIAKNQTLYAIGTVYTMIKSSVEIFGLEDYPELVYDNDENQFIPLPPKGFKWVKLSIRSQHEVPINVIAGRYYSNVNIEDCEAKSQLKGIANSDNITMMNYNYIADGDIYKPYSLSIDRDETVTSAEECSQFEHSRQWDQFIFQRQQQEQQW